MKAGEVPDGTEVVISVNGIKLQGTKISAAPSAPYITFPYSWGIWVARDREVRLANDQD